MYGSAKVVDFESAAQVKRSKVLAGLTVGVGLFAGVVGLVNVLAGNRDMADILLLVVGTLISAAGLRLLRRSHTGWASIASGSHLAPDPARRLGGRQPEPRKGLYGRAVSGRPSRTNNRLR